MCADSSTNTKTDRNKQRGEKIKKINVIQKFVSCVMWHVSHVNCHVSCVMWHVSCYQICFFKFVTKYAFLNANLSYQKKDSKWEYNIQVTNALNTDALNQDGFNDLFISSSAYMVQPRYVVFKLKYDL